MRADQPSKSSQDDPHLSGVPTFGLCRGRSDDVARSWRRLPCAGTWRRNTTTFYNVKGNLVGSSLTVGRSSSFFGRDGAFQGTLSRTGDTTNFYDRAGRYQGYATAVPPPAAVGTFNSKRRW
jgi:hypothetical protein